MQKAYEFCASSLSSGLDLAILIPVACHFRIDLGIFVFIAARNFLPRPFDFCASSSPFFCISLVILDFSNFWPIARLFRFDLAIFAPIAYHFILRPIDCL